MMLSAAAASRRDIYRLGGRRLHGWTTLLGPLFLAANCSRIRCPPPLGALRSRCASKKRRKRKRHIRAETDAVHTTGSSYFWRIRMGAALPIITPFLDDAIHARPWIPFFDSPRPSTSCTRLRIITSRRIRSFTRRVRFLSEITNSTESSIAGLRALSCEKPVHVEGGGFQGICRGRAYRSSSPGLHDPIIARLRHRTSAAGSSRPYLIALPAGLTESVFRRAYLIGDRNEEYFGKLCTVTRETDYFP